MIILILKFICLYLAVTYGYSNTAKIVKNKTVGDTQMIMMGIGIAGFICLQFIL